MLVTYNKEAIETIEGNQCKKGKDFAEKEIINPTRILTTTISIDSRKFKRLPVRSRAPAPKGIIKELINKVKKEKAKAPVKAGEVIAENLLDSGVDIIASMSIEE
ncbi:MAG: DUF1667 domain-containing protein [Actinomycetota bacterium]